MTDGTRPRAPQTAAARAGVGADPAHGAVMPPIYLSATFEYEALGRMPRYDYTRSGNPTRQILADAVTELEGGGGGVHVCSGMAAINLVFEALEPGARVVAPADAYGGTRRLLKHHAAKGRNEVDFVNLRDAEARAAAIEKRPALVHVETPSNPLMRITDVAAVAAEAKAVGALVAADNTFLSPARQKPLELGCDVVLHSVSKFINGHADVVGGVLVAKDAAAAKDYAFLANVVGATSSPFDAYQVVRGLRTLHLRVAAAEANAAAIADHLAGRKGLKAVHYPGRTDHPGHEIAKRQQSGFGAMLSFELEDGGAEKRFLEALEVFSFAASLGGVDSLACQPWSMTEFSVSPEERLASGVTEGLVRLAVGIEAAEDLIADIDRALAAAT